VPVVIAALVFFTSAWSGLADSSLDRPFSGPDLLQYCGAVATGFDEPRIWPVTRAKVAAVPALLLEWGDGPIRALWRSGALASVGLGAALFCWGRSIGGDAAGWAAVLVALTVGPLVNLQRTLGFYPVICAGFALAGGMVANAWVRDERRSDIVAGFAAGMAGTLAPQGLPLVLFWGALLLLRALFRRDSLRFGAVVASLMVTWGMGWWSFSPDVEWSHEPLANLPVWGRARFDAVQGMALADPQRVGLGDLLPAFDFSSPKGALRYAPDAWFLTGGSWGPPLAGTVCIAAIAHAWGRVAASAAVISAVPFFCALFLLSVVDLRDPAVSRFVSLAMPGVVVVYAAGLIATVHTVIEPASRGRSRRGGAGLLMLLSCAVAAIYTRVATPSNTPTWRAVPTLYRLRTLVRSDTDTGIGQPQDRMLHDPIDIRCVEALRGTSGPPHRE
jgi:hypothetical protein